MISKEHAVELVESLLALKFRQLAVYSVEEHAVGWLVFWNSAEYARTLDQRDNLVGGGPLLVDRHDGSVHHIPATTWVAEGWEERYLQEVIGIRSPDLLAASVRELLRSGGMMTAMRYLRQEAPRLSPLEARAYVVAVRDGAEPPEELARLTRQELVCPRLSIETWAGPVTSRDLGR